MGNELKKEKADIRIKELEDSNQELNKILSAKEKIISVLMARVERSVDTSGSAFSIFERQILLENLVEQRTKELKEAQKDLRKLGGLLPICSQCKSIRDDHGYWQDVDDYIRDHTSAQFSHSLCPECFKKLYPGMKF